MDPPTRTPPPEYLARVERRPDGSLRTALYRNGQAIRQETVRSVRHGRRRAYDLLCTAIDTDPLPDTIVDQQPDKPGPRSTELRDPRSPRRFSAPPRSPPTGAFPRLARLIVDLRINPTDPIRMG